MILLLVSLWLASTAPGSDLADAHALLWKVIDHQEVNQKRQRNYVYRETIRTEHLRKDGSLYRTESETFEVSPAPGGEYRRLVAKNGKPLSPEKVAEEEEKLQKFIRKQLALSPEERRRAEEKLQSRVGRFQTRVRQAMEVFDFEPLPDDVLSSRPVRVFSFTPRADYEPDSRTMKILHKLEGTVWIDPEEAQIVKLRIRFRENMNFLLGIFGRISKGTEAVAEQRRVGDEIWLLDHVDVDLNGRLYFLKRYRRHVSYRYDHYRKTKVETHESVITPSTDAGRP